VERLAEGLLRGGAAELAVGAPDSLPGRGVGLARCDHLPVGLEGLGRLSEPFAQLGAGAPGLRPEGGVELDRALEQALCAVGVEALGVSPSGAQEDLRLALRVSRLELREQREGTRVGGLELRGAREGPPRPGGVVLQLESAREAELCVRIAGLAGREGLEVGAGLARVAAGELDLGSRQQ
jgi:hypothetical protein